jgi:hypothetical protein
MKIRLPLIALLMITAAPAFAQSTQMQRGEPQVQAQADRWCRFQGLDHGSLQVCSAYTYEQCMASRNPGDASCFLNPLYDARFRRN